MGPIGSGSSGRMGGTPPVDANGNVLLPTDGMPPPGSQPPDFSTSMTTSSNSGQTTLSELFAGVLSSTTSSSSSSTLSLDATQQALLAALLASVTGDKKNEDVNGLGDAVTRVLAAISNGETPDADDMKLVMDALKTSIDDGSVAFNTTTTDTSTNALVLALVAQTQAARAQQMV